MRRGLGLAATTAFTLAVSGTGALAWNAEAASENATAYVSGGVMHYKAASGQTNQVSATRTYKSTSDSGIETITVYDRVWIIAGDGCTAYNTATTDYVTCTITTLNDAGWQRRLVVDLGDGDDSASVAAPDIAGSVVYGGSGDDVILGNGEDILYGQDGDDRLDGSMLAYGGAGSDVLTGDSNTNSDEGSIRADSSGSGNDDLVYVNSLHGGSGNDTLRGFADFDKLWGDSGNDKIHGNAGNDLLYGGKGDDKLYGGSGGDTIYGNSGDDVLHGGPDRHDKLYGGPGHDTFYKN